jgi:3-keto-5-aminohexanoate cleavage enzyme
MDNFSAPLIVNFTPTGMIPTRAMTPHVPLQVQEIIEQVHEAHEIGITLVHLHARNEQSELPDWNPDLYARIMEGIRRHCPDLVLCVSLSGRNFNEFDKRSAAIELRPDMGSLTLSSLNFTQQASVNAPDMIRDLALKMKQYGVKPELEVFDLGMIHFGRYLAEKNILEGPFYWNIIAGNIAGLQTNLSELGLAVQQLPPNSHWAFGGIGRQQLSAVALAIATGGGVRIGLEDNVYLDHHRTQLATNAALIRRVHQLAEHFERPLMSSRAFGELGFYNNKNTRP